MRRKVVREEICVTPERSPGRVLVISIAGESIAKGVNGQISVAVCSKVDDPFVGLS